ncbi:MAG: hypothetical protein M3540_01885 [Actinomycetota bacterium]|nr:hypothetical protein [Actinomycetota bacterium]
MAETLAHRSQVQAYTFARHLVIAAEGEVGESCVNVDIDESVDPSDRGVLYRLVERRDPLALCLEVITPYRVSETFGFRSAEPPTQVRIEHAEGIDTVEVEIVRSENGIETDNGATYTGTSRRFSFQEAFRKAVRQLPPKQIPDLLRTVEVTRIGGAFGGLMGIQQLTVEIKETTPGVDS